MKSISTNFLHRCFVSTGSLLLSAVSVWYSLTLFFYPVFTLLCAALVGIALTEYFDLAKKKGYSSFSKWAITSSTVYLASLSLDLLFSLNVSLWILLGFVIVSFVKSFFLSNSSLSTLAITFFGIGYLTLPLSCILRIDTFFLNQETEDGRMWLLYVLLVTKVTDIAAYFFGKACGKTQLAPTISPKKTIEGSIAGFLVALIVSVFFNLLTVNYGFHMSLFESIFMGLIISILAQLGDLAESQLKRDAGAKDSSDIPGLGGILDMVDSLVFTLPFVYCWLLTTKS